MKSIKASDNTNISPCRKLTLFGHVKMMSFEKSIHGIQGYHFGLHTMSSLPLFSFKCMCPCAVTSASWEILPWHALKKAWVESTTPIGETPNSSVVLRNCNKAHCSAILVCSCQHPFQRLASHAVVLSNLPWLHGWVLGVKCCKIHSKPRESCKSIHQKSSGWRIKDT